MAMVGLLTTWAMNFGFWHMAALYLGPLTVTNCWLVMYTWLQHTDVCATLDSLPARELLNPSVPSPQTPSS